MPNFTYNLDIPDGPHNPSVDQPDMKVNTNSIDSIIGVDHFSFESVGSLDGYHQKTTFVAGGAAATPTGSVTGYSKTVTQPEMFWRAQTNGTEYQMSNFQFGAANNGASANSLRTGYVFLPNGMILQWGIVNDNGSAWQKGVSNSYTYSSNTKAFPNATVSVQITAQKASTTNSAFGCYLNATPSASGFTFTAYGSTLDYIHFVAIGY